MTQGILTASVFNHPELVHGFSTREGGYSQGPYASLNLARNVGDDPAVVAKNLGHLRSLVEAERMIWADVRQVHGSKVVTLDHGPERPFLSQEADAIITSHQGWLIGVRTADCVPILLAGPGVVAAIHAGWRGTTLRIVNEVVQLIEARYGLTPSSLKAAIGPAIGGRAYSVGMEVVDGVTRALGNDPGGIQGVVFKPGEPTPEGPYSGREELDRFRVDLKEANRRLLIEAGVSSRSIEVLPHCTVNLPDLFYSHRRDHGKTGRMFNFIGLRWERR